MSESESLVPKKAVPLDSLKAVRAECARIYRLTLKGVIKSEEATRFVWILGQVRSCIEAETLDGVHERLAALNIAVGARR